MAVRGSCGAGRVAARDRQPQYARGEIYFGWAAVDSAYLRHACTLPRPYAYRQQSLGLLSPRSLFWSLCASRETVTLISSGVQINGLFSFIPSVCLLFCCALLTIMIHASWKAAVFRSRPCPCSTARRFSDSAALRDQAKSGCLVGPRAHAPSSWFGRRRKLHWGSKICSKRVFLQGARLR